MPLVEAPDPTAELPSDGSGTSCSLRIGDTIKGPCSYFSREVQAAYLAGKVAQKMRCGPPYPNLSKNEFESLDRRLVEMSTALFEQSTGSLRIGCSAIATVLT